jgi:hypothetical protein
MAVLDSQSEGILTQMSQHLQALAGKSYNTDVKYVQASVNKNCNTDATVLTGFSYYAYNL